MSYTLKTLVTFNSTDGANPFSGLYADAAGNLFGTTFGGGANDSGTVFELVNTGTTAQPGYDPTVKTLATFTGANGATPVAGLIADAAGNLFGTTSAGGANNDGTVFEVANTGTAGSPHYLSGATTLINFSGANGQNPQSDLVLDAAGNLFGTTVQGGANSAGTVFEVANNGLAGTPPVYSSSVTTLATFNFNGGNGGGNGADPSGGLILDAAGNLFGTTAGGGLGNVGTVFEIMKGSGIVTTLHSFNGVDGAGPQGALTRDAAGNLYGTTAGGGLGDATGYGTVFEVVNTGPAGSPTYGSGVLTLVTFNDTNGSGPLGGSLSFDAAGNLYGTTLFGGNTNHEDGTVFEIVKGSGVATTLHAFTGGADGANPESVTLVHDSAGNLYGTTSFGGGTGYGTVFELALTSNAPAITSETANPTNTALDAGKTVTFTLATSEAVTATGSSLMLSNGATAAYASGDGTTTPLTYAYTIAQGDTNTADLQATALTGTIADGAGNPLSGFTPIDTKDIVDTVAPTVAADGAPAFFDSLHATVLTGTAADTGSGIASVEVYNAAAGMADLGAATVQNGAWSLAVALAAGTYTIDAVATDRAGNAATSAVAPYELITGIAGQPYVGEQLNFGASGALATETFYNTDGSVYAAAALSTLSNGDAQTVYTGGSVFAALPYTGYADDVRPDGTLAAETFFERDGTTLAYGYGADGTTLQTETLYANGAVELSKAFTTLANGDTQIAYAGPLFDANPVYSGYTDVVHNGQVLSETLINRDGTQTRESYDTSGTRVGETVYNPDGSVQVSKAFTTLANGDGVTAYTGGSVFNGLPYASYTDEYKPGAAAPAVETVANRDGSVSVQALAQNVALAGSAAPDSFVFGASLGQDSVANFTVAGAAHDTLVLPSSDFATLAAAIAGTRQSGADTIITAANNDQITLTNVNAATLTAPANAADFRFA